MTQPVYDLINNTIYSLKAVTDLEQAAADLFTNTVNNLNIGSLTGYVFGAVTAYDQLVFQYIAQYGNTSSLLELVRGEAQGVLDIVGGVGIPDTSNLRQRVNDIVNNAGGNLPPLTLAYIEYLALYYPYYVLDLLGGGSLPTVGGIRQQVLDIVAQYTGGGLPFGDTIRRIENDPVGYVYYVLYFYGIGVPDPQYYETLVLYTLYELEYQYIYNNTYYQFVIGVVNNPLYQVAQVEQIAYSGVYLVQSEANYVAATALAAVYNVINNPQVQNVLHTVTGIDPVALANSTVALATATALYYVSYGQGQANYYAGVVLTNVNQALATATGYENTVLALEAATKKNTVDPTVATATALATQTAGLATATIYGAVALATAAVNNELAQYPGQIASAQKTANDTVASAQKTIAALQAQYVTPNVNAAMAAAVAAQKTATDTAAQAQAIIASAPATAAGQVAAAQAAAGAAAALVTATALAEVAAGTAAITALKTTYIDPAVNTATLTAAAALLAVQGQANAAQALATATVNGLPGMIDSAQKTVAAQQKALTDQINALKTSTVDPVVANVLATIAAVQKQATDQIAGLLIQVNTQAAAANALITSYANQAQALIANSPGVEEQILNSLAAQVFAAAVPLVSTGISTAEAALTIAESAQAQVLAALPVQPRKTYFNYPYLRNDFKTTGTAPVLNSIDGNASYLSGSISPTLASGEAVALIATASPGYTYKQPMFLVVQASAVFTGGTDTGVTKLTFDEQTGSSEGASGADPITFVSIPNDGQYHLVRVPVTGDALTNLGSGTCRLILSSTVNPGQGSAVKISAAYLEQEVPVIPPTPLNGTVQMVGTTGGMQLISETTLNQSGQANLSTASSLTCIGSAFNVAGVGSLAQIICNSAVTATGTLGGGFFVYSSQINCTGSASENINGYFAPTTGAAEQIVGSAQLAIGAPIVTGFALTNAVGAATLYCAATSVPPLASYTEQIVGAGALFCTGNALPINPFVGSVSMVGQAVETVSGYNDPNVRLGSASLATSSSMGVSGYHLGPVGQEGPIVIVSAPDTVQSGSVVAVRAQAVDASGTRLTFVGPPSVRIFNFDAAGNESVLVDYTSMTQQGQSYLYNWQVAGLGPYVIEVSGTSTTLGNVVGVQTVLVNQGTIPTNNVPAPLQGGVLG